MQIAGIIILFLYAIWMGDAFTADTIAVAAIGGADGQTAIMTTGNLTWIPTVVSWVVTLVTIYSGYDYLHRNWALVAEGATRPKA